MNFNFLPGSSPTFSKIDPDGKPVATDAYLVTRMQRQEAGLLPHHRQVARQVVVAAFLIIALAFAGKVLAGQARLVLTVGGQQRMFEGRVTQRMTVLDALNASVLAGGIDMRFSIDARNNHTQVWMIDGYRSQDRPVNLQIVVNDQSINATEIHQARVAAGDTIAITVMQ
ncbi:MAG: hypothetical protein AAB864_01615 [Patescibacteria group bacterium]